LQVFWRLLIFFTLIFSLFDRLGTVKCCVRAVLCKTVILEKKEFESPLRRILGCKTAQEDFGRLSLNKKVRVLRL
jgi:hypothetical protein